jgi:3-methyladenine DNA glycosylase AlkC
MFNSAQMTAKQQQEIMKKKFNIGSSSQSRLRAVAAKSSDKSLRFWGQRLGKKSMTPTQVKEILGKLSKEKKAPLIKNVETRVDTYKAEEKKIEQEKIAKIEKEEVLERSRKYRKYLRRGEESYEFRDIRKDIREEMGRRERARLEGTSNSKEVEKSDNKNKAVISASSLSTKKRGDNKENISLQGSVAPPDLPLD